MWWGVINVVQVELAMIHPPVGVIVFLLHGLAPDISMGTIYRGVVPFIFADLLVLLLFDRLPRHRTLASPKARHVNATFREYPIPSPRSRPYILAYGPDGNIWFCESGVGKIGRLSLNDERITEFDLPSRDCQPIGIVAGADGNLWFTESSAGKVGRITPGR